MKQMVQIVTGLPPLIDGVGDYGLRLASELRARHGVETVFLCGHPAWPGPEKVDGFPVRAIGPDRAKEFPRLLREVAPAGSAVLLNYVGPGYDRNSCPWWLLRGLQDWKRRTRGGRLLTMFHELYSEGPPWTRPFWTNPLQRWIGRGLAQLSDEVRTNVQVVRGRLEAMVPELGGRITCTPVFSNVGEPAVNVPYGDRQPWLMVFGSAGWRRRAFLDQAGSLRRACDVLRVEKILDVGAPLTEAIATPVPRESTGLLPAAEISRRLSQARAGYIAYPAQWLGKSGIFAAYAAHGLIPVTNEGNLHPAAELRAGHEYLTADMLDRPDAALAAFSDGIFRWYAGHSCARQADDILWLLDPRKVPTTTVNRGAEPQLARP